MSTYCIQTIRFDPLTLLNLIKLAADGAGLSPQLSGFDNTSNLREDGRFHNISSPYFFRSPFVFNDFFGMNGVLFVIELCLD